MEKVLHTFSMMKVLRTFSWPFLYDDVTMVTSGAAHEIRIHTFSNSDCETEAKQPQEVLESKLELRLREGSPMSQRGIWSTCNLLITVGLYAQ